MWGSAELIGWPRERSAEDSGSAATLNRTFIAPNCPHPLSVGRIFLSMPVCVCDTTLAVLPCVSAVHDSQHDGVPRSPVFGGRPVDRALLRGVVEGVKGHALGSTQITCPDEHWEMLLSIILT